MSARVYIFTGPTLSATEGHAELEALFLPPVARGDVYQAALDQPLAIGIIDGYFERVPSVWHKEILWAMSQGIHVFGSASMGALRAAELSAFGMVGVGEVFEAFRNGALEDDDEVAVAHAPAEHGYRPLSEAMVNIRATLRAAEAQGVIGEAVRGTLERLAKELFYPDRTYPRLLAQALREGLPASALEPLRGWLPRGQVNQKRKDALAMLRAMRAHLTSPPTPKHVQYTFEHTDAWAHLQLSSHRVPLAPQAASIAQSAEGVPLKALVEELQVSGAFASIRKGALARALALDLTRRLGRTVPPEALHAAAEAFRRERGLFQPEQFQRWCEEQRLNDLEGFFRRESQVRWVETLFEPDVERNLMDQLRVEGLLPALLARAEDKR
ncbi:MAG TPA: TfuA-like protein [Myxococcaceae bacterium]|jgi:hypothetical protein